MNSLCSFKKRQILFSFIAIMASILFGGCADRDNIVSDNSGDNTPSITVSFSHTDAGAGSENRIEAILQVEGRQAPIAEIIYLISGQTDTLHYSPALMEITEVIPLSYDIVPGHDTRLTLTIIAIDEFGEISRFEHSFDPIDIKLPTISIEYDSSHGYAPNGSVPVHIVATDNLGLYSISLSTAGAFAWTGTLSFAEPYPTEIDTVISIPVPTGTFMGIEFWITAEATDINFNTRTVSSEENLTISFASGPVTEIHQVGGGSWAHRGDSLRFWVVGYDNAPLSCLGYHLEYGRNEVWFTINLRDSLSGEFNNIDSVYFAYYIPDTAYCDNYLYLRSFAYDTNSRYSIKYNYFHVENHLRVSQATEFDISTPNSWSLLLVDDRRERVYILNHFSNRIDVYSQTSREFLIPITLSVEPSWFCLSADTNSILVTNEEARSVSIIDLNNATPQPDTAISLPGKPYRIAALSDNTALILTTFDNSMSSVLRLNLSDYTLDSLELGTGPLFEVVASGNSEYALIAAYGTTGADLFVYQSQVGVVTTGSVDQRPFWASVNHDGSRFVIGNWNFGNAVVLDGNLDLLATIPDNSCNQFVEWGVFSRDGADLYLKSLESLGHAAGGNWTTEDFYGFWPDTEILTFIGLATNATDDRLFVTGQKGVFDFFFWDIPIDPQ